MEKTGLSAVGKLFVENLMLGSVVDAQGLEIMSREGSKSYRRRVVKAIVPLMKSNAVDQSVAKDLNVAIGYLYEAKAKHGGSLEEMVLQLDMFENNATLYDVDGMDMAISMNKTDKEFREFVLYLYEKLTQEDMFQPKLTKKKIYEQHRERYTPQELQAIDTVQRRDSQNVDMQAGGADRSGADDGGQRAGTGGADQTSNSQNAGRATREVEVGSRTEKSTSGKQSEIDAQYHVEQKAQEKIAQLENAVGFIRNVFSKNLTDKGVKMALPNSVNSEIEKILDHKVETHHINANEIRHAFNRHGEGNEIDQNQIPLRREDFELIPYIMTSPDRIERGSGKNNIESIRYVKDLSNGYAVVVEREVANKKTHLANITMWVRMSDANANTAEASPLRPKREFIERSDIAKIKKDAEKAIANDEKLLGRASVGESEQKATQRVVEMIRNAGVEVEMTESLTAEKVLSDQREKQTKEALERLEKAAMFVRQALKAKSPYKAFVMKLPAVTLRRVRAVMGRDFDSHSIEIGGVRHALKNHGESGRKLTERSIPITEENAELIPYIMTSPDYVRRGSTENNRESVRFYKNLSNGYVVVVEKEQTNSPQDMDTINMWAEAFSDAVDAQSKTALNHTSKNAAISRNDIAKIKKDAEKAIANDEKLQSGTLATTKGVVYGYTVGGKIYLTPEGLNPNTPVHEYTHIWDMACRESNPELWNRGVQLMKQTPQWSEVVNDANYESIVHDQDLVASEVHARLSGERSKEAFEKITQEIRAEKSVMAVAEKVQNRSRLKDWLQEFWGWVKSAVTNWSEKRAKEVSVDEFVQMPLKDLAEGKRLQNEKILAAVGNQKVADQKFDEVERSLTGDYIRFREGELSEIKQVKQRAEENGTFMKAPNGEPTNLTERQWLQVRGKAFKEWFGDWEKQARIEKLKHAKSVEISGDEIAKTTEVSVLKPLAEKYGLDKHRGVFTNEDTGSSINVVRDSIRETVRHGYELSHLQSIAAIPQMIKEATYITSEPNREPSKKSQNVVTFDYYVVGLRIDSIDYTAKLAIGVDVNGNKFYDHALTEIEKSDLISQLGISVPISKNKTALSEVKDRRLISILQNNSSKVVDANGEPLVVYHGTKRDFDSFDADMVNVEDAFFFTDNTKLANNFGRGDGGSVMPVFLRVVDPSVVDAQGRQYGIGVIKGMIDVGEIVDDARRSGNDGCIINNIVDTAFSTGGKLSNQYLAFSATQIKSATANNGEFSASDADIRYKDLLEDWELVAKSVNVVKAELSDFRNFAEAKQWAKNNIARVYSNKETGGKGEIEISKTAIDKYFNGSSVSKSENQEAHKSVIKVLPEIIKESVVGEVHSDYIKKDGIRDPKNGVVPNTEIHRLFGAVEINSNIYRVKTTVKYFTDKSANNKAHTYEVMKIELLDESNSSERNQDSQTVSPIPTTKLLKGVEKSYEKGKFIINDNSSKAVDANGEPLVENVEINQKFNRELAQQIEGTLPNGHIYKLGMPNEILLSAGLADLPMELSAKRLETKASEQYANNHPFDISSIKNLPLALQNPIAVFNSKSRTDSKVVLTELKSNKFSFVVAIQTSRKEGRLFVNSVRSVYPKNQINDIVSWINGGMLTFVNREKATNFILNSSNPADVSNKNDSSIKDVTKIVQNFENPTVLQGFKLSEIERVSQELNTPVRVVKKAEIKEGGRKRGAKGWYGLPNKFWTISQEAINKFLLIILL